MLTPSHLTLRAAWLLVATIMLGDGRARQAREALWNVIRPRPSETWRTGEIVIKRHDVES